LFRTLIGKVFGSICSVAAGLAVGKEGPLVHVGSCIASLLGEGGVGKWKVKWDWYKLFRNDRDRRDLVTMGGAAGVAAAFKAPVGGVLFVLEESASWMRPQLLWKTFFTTAMVHISIRGMRSWCSDGACGHFGKAGEGSAGLILFNVSRGQFDYSVMELFPCILLGVVGGCGGALFIHLNTIICVWRRDNQKGKRKVIEAALIALLTATCSFCLPLLFSCTPCPSEDTLPEGVLCPRPVEDWRGNFVNFGCADPKHEYNELATLIFNTQDDAIKNLFSMNTAEMYSHATLVFYGVVFYLLAIVTYGISVPSGLFIPCIICGSSYGRLVGMFMVKYYHPSYDIGIEEGTYALLGAASFLGGTMRMTISLCVILIELSNNVAFLPLLMITLLVAKSVGDLFNEGIYDTHVGLKFMPLLEQQPHSFMRHLTAHDVMAKEVVEFGSVERVGYIMEALRNTQHNGFPVASRRQGGPDSPNPGQSETRFAGCVLRSQLLLLLQCRQFQATPEAPQTDEEMERAYNYKTMDFSKVPTATGLMVDDIQLTTDQENQYINLLPFVNPNPYVVQQGTSLGKVYSLFRSLGIRHLFVIKRVEKIIGVITRKDLLPEFAEQRHKTKTIGQGERRQRSNTLRNRAQQQAESEEAPWSPRNSKRRPLEGHETVPVTSVHLS